MTTHHQNQNKRKYPPLDLSLAFLSKPKTLVLKDDWQEIFLKSANKDDGDVTNCPIFQSIVTQSRKQFNVINVTWHGTMVFDKTGTIWIPNGCFRKDMTSTPYMKGE